MRADKTSGRTRQQTDKRTFPIHEGRVHFTRRQLTSRAFNARVHSSIYIYMSHTLAHTWSLVCLKPYLYKKRRGFLWGAGSAPQAQGPGQGHPRTTRHPLRPAKSHPRATQDHVGRPKSRQEVPGGLPEL